MFAIDFIFGKRFFPTLHNLLHENKCLDQNIECFLPKTSSLIAFLPALQELAKNEGFVDNKIEKTAGSKQDDKFWVL